MGDEMQTDATMTDQRAVWTRRALLAAHWTTIFLFGTQVLYAVFQVFYVLGVPGGGPLFGRAAAIPTELLVARRLYAIEGWIAGGGLAAYLAITEMAPRLSLQRSLKASWQPAPGAAEAVPSTPMGVAVPVEAWQPMANAAVNAPAVDDLQLDAPAPESVRTDPGLLLVDEHDEQVKIAAV